MNARRLGLSAAAGVLAVVVAFAGVGRAQEEQAQEPPPACPEASDGLGPSVTIDRPAEGAVVTTPGDATIIGTAESSGVVECVELSIARVVDGQPQEVGRAVATLDPPVNEYEIVWPPPLPYNDAYVVTAIAVGTSNVGQRRGRAVRQFRTEIPPATPTGLKIGINQEKREASLTWNANPEADVVGYIVERAPAEGPFGEVGRPQTPAFVENLGPLPPGNYRYRVTAVRRKTQNPADTEGIASPAPAEGSAELKGPPTATTTSTPPTTRPTATTARPRRPANRVDLGRFGPTSTIPDGSQEPEEGAFGDLEFGERQDGRTDITITELGEPVTEDGDEERPSSLLYFAGGLLAFVVLMHLRWIKKEVDRVTLEEVPPKA